MEWSLFSVLFVDGPYYVLYMKIRSSIILHRCSSVYITVPRLMFKNEPFICGN